MIEVSESMYTVAARQFEMGKDVAETVKLTQHPVDVVEKWYAEYCKSKASNIISDEEFAENVKTRMDMLKSLREN